MKSSGYSSSVCVKIIFSALLLFSSNPTASAVPGDGHWDRQFNMPGTGTRNYALAFNQSNVLYTAGIGIGLNGLTATNTVLNIFDGTNWSTLAGLGGSLALVEDIAFLGTDVYAGGIFTRAGSVPAVGLAKWDGANWSDVGGFSGLVLGLTTDGTNLYVGGSFTNAGGIYATNVAKWDGTSWSAMGDGLGYYGAGTYPAVNGFAWHNGELYACGGFTNSGANAVINVARWDGSAWMPVGGGVGGAADSVLTMQFSGDDLYVGGKFTTANGTAALNIAKWDGNTWSALGSGLKGPANSTPVSALAFLGPDLYVTGSFTNAGGITATRVAKWDGSAWSAIGSINSTGIRAVSNSGSIYIAGAFNLAGNYVANHIARYDGSLWHGVTGKPALGTHIFVQALAQGSDGLYLGGFFNAVGDILASRIARYDGTSWNALGSGLTGAAINGSQVARAINMRNNEVYVGGDFSSASGITCSNFAKWDGANWSALTSGFDATVSAIEFLGSDIFAGGSFTNEYDAPGVPYRVNRIARWDGAYWWSLGSGVVGNGSVFALAAAGSDLYVGGSFTNVDGVPANRIAKWDGANWSALGPGTSNGVNNSVFTILVDGSDVYAGGQFTNAGGRAARCVAKWDGANWSALGSGMLNNGTATVRALAKIGPYLYASGRYTNAGGVTARSIARWDGGTWEALGSGIGIYMAASEGSEMAVSGNDLYVGGIFEDAGGGDAGYLAHWNDQIDFTPPAILRLTAPQKQSASNVTFRATATDRAAYVIEQSVDLSNWTALATNSLPFLDVTNPADADFKTYRLREIP